MLSIINTLKTKFRTPPSGKPNNKTKIKEKAELEEKSQKVYHQRYKKQ